jgi:hypothetical protein
MDWIRVLYIIPVPGNPVVLYFYYKCSMYMFVCLFVCLCLGRKIHDLNQTVHLPLFVFLFCFFASKVMSMDLVIRWSIVKKPSYVSVPINYMSLRYISRRHHRVAVVATTMMMMMMIHTTKKVE